MNANTPSERKKGYNRRTLIIGHGAPRSVLPGPLLDGLQAHKVALLVVCSGQAFEKNFIAEAISSPTEARKFQFT